ncbi:hypothetical protein LZF95_14225 [Algoriphagus sp. AGSA1]|uniref:hypothetical protein n=1 Tax=Algoriphagus sp. AGSA1 TaxID=2907213 RepID=UPI001F4747E1|nr:hypothetical protein [Algoriphagus sp. AGSA1]MCE7055834.1 hypothetical protein [Algoriphagus sp. AGSA1]
MEDYFLTRFQKKTRIELQRIVDNQEQYRPEAVLAATKLLNKNLSEQVLPVLDEAADPTKEKKLEVDRLSLSLDYRPFFRTLSYREFLTAISIALFALAIIGIINYYSDERFFKDTHSTWKLYTILFVFIANHVVYRHEHKRSNNFLGRSINDLFLLVSLVLLATCHQFIIGSTYNFRIENGFLGIIIIVTVITMAIFSFEIGLGFLKMLLKKIKCQIF